MRQTAYRPHFFMMIVGIILTSVSLGQLLETYSQQTLNFSFLLVGLVALALGSFGLIKLEPKLSGIQTSETQQGESYTWGQMVTAITKNKQATRFFFYLILLLTAILGQDILLEPYGAKAFGLSVQAMRVQEQHPLLAVPELPQLELGQTLYL